MSAKPTPFYAKCLLALCFFLCCSLSVLAQVEPDTVKRKPALPTGPPAGEQPVYTPKPKPQPQPKPPVQPQPEVVKPQQQEEEKEKKEFIDKLYFGGSLGLQFGSYTNISLLPIIGYRVTDKFSVGTGAVYHFISASDISLHNFGGRLFTQLEVVDVMDGAIVAHAEVEALSTEYLDVDNTTNTYEIKRKMLMLPMFGAGYRQRISDKASFDLLLLYNGNSDLANPYSNPVIRAGINLPFRR